LSKINGFTPDFKGGLLWDWVAYWIYHVSYAKESLAIFEIWYLLGPGFDPCLDIRSGIAAILGEYKELPGS
jgi:hypothetical protein